MIRNAIIALLFYLPVIATAQRQELFGRIVSDEASTPLATVYVININTGTETKTDGKGDFTIFAMPGDMLTVYSKTTEVREFRVKEHFFKEVPFLFAVRVKAYEMDEVVINENINSVNLGIVPKNQKKYTPAEKRLYTAGDFKPIHLLGLLGGSLQLDPIINAINGKTKRIKKEVAVEKKEFLIEDVYGLYTEDEITREFSIPKEHVKGFVYFLVEDKEFVEAATANNPESTRFIIARLAGQYLNNITE